MAESGQLVVSHATACLATRLLPKLKKFADTFPEIVLEVTTSNDPVDLVAGGFDAGIHIGELIQRDMVAVRVSDDFRLAVVGSRDYLRRHRAPRIPLELEGHSCIGFRFGGSVYRWKFEKAKKSDDRVPAGPLILDEPDLVIQAMYGIGIGTALDLYCYI